MILSIINSVTIFLITVAVVYHYVVFLDSNRKLTDDLELSKAEAKKDLLTAKTELDGTIESNRKTSAVLLSDTRNQLNKKIDTTSTRLDSTSTKLDTTTSRLDKSDKDLTKKTDDLSKFYQGLSTAVTTKQVNTDNVDLKGTLWFGKDDKSSDPYSLRKVSDGPNKSSLRFTINDDPDESLQIFGNSCGSAGGCGGPGVMQHKFDAVGNAEHKGATTTKDLVTTGNAFFRGGVSEHNPNKWQTHFPWSGDNKNYIRGDTEVRGNLTTIGNVNANRPINVVPGDMGAFIEKVYGGKGDRYGVGQFGNGAMRTYTATKYGLASVNMSLAKDDGTFDDIVTVKTDGSTTVKNQLNVGKDLCVAGTCVSKDNLNRIKNAPVCRDTATPWNDMGNSYIFLDRHDVRCQDDEQLVQQKLTGDGKNKIRVNYRCCKY